MSLDRNLDVAAMLKILELKLKINVLLKEMILAIWIFKKLSTMLYASYAEMSERLKR